MPCLAGRSIDILLDGLCRGLNLGVAPYARYLIPHPGSLQIWLHGNGSWLCWHFFLVRSVWISDVTLWFVLNSKQKQPHWGKIGNWRGAKRKECRVIQPIWNVQGKRMQLWVKSIHHWQCDTCQQWSIGIQATCQGSQRRLFAYAMISSGNQRSLFSTLSQVMSVSLIRPLNLRAILDSTGGSWMVHVERKPMLDAGRCWKNRIEIIKSSRCREHLEDLERCFSGTPNCKAQKLKYSFVP